MKKTLLLQFLFCTLFSFAQENTLLRTPALNTNGTAISFSYQGDIWTVAANGGIARRLTIHESYESNPQWSPDGQHIVFQGNRYGNNDLFLIDAAGNTPKRLTYHSASDGVPRWGHDGQIYFTSKRAFAQVEWESEIHQISKTGGTPKRALDATALMPSPSPNGKFIAFIRGACRVSREAYKGPANRNIWIFNTKNKKYTQLTDFDGQDIYPDWGGKYLYYLSAQNGKYNIFQQEIDGKGLAKGNAIPLTNFTDEGIRYFDLSADGSKIVFDRGTHLYIMDAKTGASPKELKIEVTNDYRFDPIEHKTFSKEASNFALSPNEKQIAFIVHGELFIKPNDKEKKRAVQLTKHAYRDGEPTWINDTTLLFVSDRNGNFDLFAVQSADNDQANLYKTFKLTTIQLTSNPADEEDTYISPNYKQIVFRRGRGQLVIADIVVDSRKAVSLQNERLLLDGWASPGGISWSPDSRWLAYSLDDLDFNEEIYIHGVEGNQKPINVSLHPRQDYDPVWSRDGTKLGFLSERNNGDSDVWFVWLKKSDWEKTKRDWEENEEEEKPKKDKKKKEDKKEKKKKEPIEIDFEDIHERIVQVTSMAGDEDDLMISKDGESFYFTNDKGGSGSNADLMSIKWDGSELKTLSSKIRLFALYLDKPGKKLYAIKSGGSLISIAVDGGKLSTQSFSAKMDINHQAEREQVFNEGWRRLRDGFYDPNFHGRDFKALKERYYDRCINASTTQDFRFYFNEMLGQLDASHMGMRGGTSPEDTQKESTGRIGVELVPVTNGVKITSIVPNTPADRTDSKLNVGDIIKSVNGSAIDNKVNFYSLLNGQSNERILLSVKNNTGTNREVILRPSKSIRNDLYNAWVKERKRLTTQYSNGRLGYIHIRGMNWSSFERFERELTASGLGKEGLVIDVRFNGGGWTTDMLMTVLTVRQHAYTVPRGAAKNLEKENLNYSNHYPYGERLPYSNLNKASIAMCNEFSYSNAEIFSHAYKHLGLGTLVGQPTFGAVISTGGKGLLDGSFVRMPFRAWYVKATKENMEHGPAVPDILVKNAPDSKVNGEDPQLKRAVAELLKQIGR